MKKHRSRRVHKHLFPSVLKAVGITVVASAAGLSMLGMERYTAIAAEILPQFTPNGATENEVSATQRVHHFAMAIVGGRSTIPELAQYQLVELELLAKGAEPTVLLRLQPMGQDQPIQTYEKAVSEAYFSDVWQHLRDLEMAQLTNLSPYTEQLVNDKAASRSLAVVPTASATYRFQFKDGLYDYPNSFEVHAPEQLADSRYQGVRDLTFVVLSQNFNDVLGQ